MMTHTPGPWTHDEGSILAPDGYQIAAVLPRNRQGDQALIAAALDLLEAGEATLAYLQTLLPVTMSTSVCILLLEEAIAKATGGD